MKVVLSLFAEINMPKSPFVFYLSKNGIGYLISICLSTLCSYLVDGMDQCRMLIILESVESGEYFYLSCHKHPTATMVGGQKGFHCGY